MKKIYEIKNSVLYRIVELKFSCSFEKRQDGSYDAKNLQYDKNVDFMQLANYLRQAGDFYAAYLREHTPPTT
jgi:hypothetical protein